MAVSEWSDRKQIENELVVCRMALNICWAAGGVFLLLGVTSEVTKITLGLAPASWFLLVVASLLAAIIFKVGWVVAWYLKIAK